MNRVYIPALQVSNSNRCSRDGPFQNAAAATSLLPLRLGCGNVRHRRCALSTKFTNICYSIVAAGGGVLYYISGYHRPFSLTDIAISYPVEDNIVSIPVLISIALIAPAGIIVVFSLLARLLGITSYNPQHKRWLQALWEIHAGLIGLCAALAGTLFVTSGLKDMVGKPRPNLLARCEADLSRMAGFVVGGFGTDIDSEASSLVTSGICKQPDKRLLDDSFAAFPSGHSSFACAGLVYLTLWLCARFSLKIPYLDYNSGSTSHDLVSKRSSEGGQSAPPLWQFVAALFPTIVALFICSSRYADFHHAGFDIICGAILGTFFAFSSFRLYHLPIRRSRGALAWRERSRSHAFFSSPAQYEQRTGDEAEFSTGTYTARGAGAYTTSESYELRDSEVGTNPIFCEPHHAR